MARNLLIIMADEYRPDFLGCAGHPTIKTPNLDALAARGTRFTRAYTPSPVCVPARASFMTGRYVHELGTWSSAEAYQGRPDSWGHLARRAGHKAVSVGKLHHRSSEDDNGFAPEVLPLHIKNGLGFTFGLLRDPNPPYDAPADLAREIGKGETSYTRYDLDVTRQSLQWLENQATGDTKPWVLFVSLVSPHYPLVAPQDLFDLYTDSDAGTPHRAKERPSHGTLKQMYHYYNYSDYFDDSQQSTARRAYMGLCSFVDHQVGLLVDKLASLGLEAGTDVVFTSDHGDMLGDHGMWTKMLMYDASAGIPMILAGPEGCAGRVCDTPVSLIDIFPTVAESLELTDPDAATRPGLSLQHIARGLVARDRAAFSEFHDGGSPTGLFMLRKENMKLVYYPGDRPQLFDLDKDPHEDVDLVEAGGHDAVMQEMESELRRICDPEAVNKRAFADQAKKVKALGGRAAILASAGGFGYTPIEPA